MTSSSSQLTDVHEQMERAVDIENQLAAGASQKETSMKSRLRMQLCEVLSDVILGHPRYSHRHDVFGRLWRHCFYSRINELRSRINREMRKNGPNLQKYQESLQVFLKEAVVLYEYLIKQYEQMLMKEQEQFSKDDEDNMSTSTASNTDSVVAGLSKMFLYVGDLQRYLKDYKQAEQYYHKASKLAPGKGNPFNQLAVIAQLKDPSAPLSAVSLYYYVRAVCACRDPFTTAKDNLSRLFQSNRDALEKQESSYSAKVGGNTSSKSAMSRLFLTQFVDLHYDFFRGVRLNDSGDEKWIREIDVQPKILKLVDNFSKLLADSTFGDALLCKMVTIGAFSVSYSQKSDKQLTSHYAQAFLLHFGYALSSRLEQNLSKFVDEKKSGIPSVRVLMPLVLLCDYLAAIQSNDDEILDEDDKPEFFINAEQLFWEMIAKLANALSPLVGSLGRKSGGTLGEYERLRGFEPYLPFLTECGLNPNSPSPDEAVRALGLSQSQTQESIVSDKSSGSAAEENPVKVDRFYTILDRLSDKGTPLARDGYVYRCTLVQEDKLVDDDDDVHVELDDDPVVEFQTDSPPKQRDEVADVAPMDETTDDDVLVYKRSEGGQGPALLVPGALLLNQANDASPVAAEETKPAAKPAETVASAMNENKLNDLLAAPRAEPPLESTSFLQGVDLTARFQEPAAARVAPLLGPPPGIMPPPGFGGPTASAPASQPLAQQPLIDRLPPGVPNFAASQQYPPMPSFAPAEPTILDMLGVSNVATNNPFATSTAQIGGVAFSSGQPLFGSYQGPNSGASFLTEQDEDGLLGSSLLDSIMKSDESGHSKKLSQNPFLT